LQHIASELLLNRLDQPGAPCRPEIGERPAGLVLPVPVVAPHLLDQAGGKRPGWEIEAGELVEGQRGDVLIELLGPP
jgi:hypothetical protein